MIKKSTVSLAQDTIDATDISKLINWLSQDGVRLTQGPATILFENKCSQWLDTGFGTMVNSGSSANLLMIYSLLASKQLLPGDRVVVPALCWATDLAPIIQLGLTPVLCDCNMDDLSVDIDMLKEIFERDNPKALMLVSVLGFVPDMEKIVSICDEYRVILLEDVCESTGSMFNNRKLGTFGLMSTFSFYFGHHISTIEGGMVCSHSAEMNDVLKSLRSHGWDRDTSEDFKKQKREMWNVSDFNASFTFYYPGFNLRGNDLQAQMGLFQLEKINAVCEKRNFNLRFYLENLPDSFWRPKLRDNCFISNFSYPLIHEKRDDIVTALIKEGIECRPLICGSMGRQPFFVERYGEVSFPNVDKIDKFGMYIPNHPNLSLADLEKITTILKEF